MTKWPIISWHKDLKSSNHSKAVNAVDARANACYMLWTRRDFWSMLQCAHAASDVLSLDSPLLWFSDHACNAMLDDELLKEKYHAMLNAQWWTSQGKLRCNAQCDARQLAMWSTINELWPPIKTKFLWAWFNFHLLAISIRFFKTSLERIIGKRSYVFLSNSDVQLCFRFPVSLFDRL